MKTILACLLALVVWSASADPLPDGTEFLGHAITRVHLLNYGTNGITVSCTANQFTGQLDWPSGSALLLPVNGATLTVSGTNYVTSDDGTELWVVNTLTGVVSWVTPAASTPTPDHWHLYWLGFGFAFALYGGFWLLLRIVKKTVNHGAGL